MSMCVECKYVQSFPFYFSLLFSSLKKLGTLCIWDKKSQNHTGEFYISTHFHILLDFLVGKENLMLESSWA